MMSTVVGLGLAAGLLLPAHPLGNFTVNQYAGLRVGTGGIAVDYVLDLAELPAYQIRTQEIDSNPGGAAGWAGKACADVAGATRLAVGGRPVTLLVDSAAATLPAGQAGLSTVRLECRLRAPVTIDRETTVSYRGSAYPDRIGWREVTAVGDGVTLVESDVPAGSMSNRLSGYPSDALNATPDLRTATLRVRPGGPALTAAEGTVSVRAPSRGADRLTAQFVSLVGRRDLSLGLGFVALALALLLGALHAFAPGHGKTVLAAYLVGERGSLRHAMTVAGTVTLTHTAGVLVLGVLLATSVRLAPGRLYTWLGAASGLLLAGVGAAMLRRARHHRRHHHDHDHDHHDHGEVGPLRTRALVAMGFAGGLAPSPSAVVVLLGAVALGHTWFGVLLVIGYGVGMAAALVTLGVVLSRWRAVFAARAGGRLAGFVRRTVPVFAAGLVMLVGLGLVARSLAGLG